MPKLCRTALMDYVKARKHMVDSQVRPNDVTDIGLQQAMENIAREDFVPANKRAMAYAEMDIELAPGRFLLRARDFSKLVHSARVTADSLILDVGCGYGYSTVVLAQLGDMVMALENEPELASMAEKKIAGLDVSNAVVVTGPLATGLPDQGAFDVIIMASGVLECAPDSLLAQLKEGGRLACILLQNGIASVMLYTRSGANIGQRVIFEAATKARFSAFRQEPTFRF